MTFDEAKEMLRQIRAGKNKARDIVRDIKECESSIAALTFRSPLAGRDRVDGGGQRDSIEERIVCMIEEKQARLAAALDAVFALEDELAAAIDTLTETERDVIVNYYMRDKTNLRLAQEMNFSTRAIGYIKARAIKKLSRKL